MECSTDLCISIHSSFYVHINSSYTPKSKTFPLQQIANRVMLSAAIRRLDENIK